MAKKAKMTVHPSYRIGTLEQRLYSAFLEPIGSMVNGSMYNPKHPTADDKGFRRDFIQGIQAAGVPAVRLPGGNFVSGWDWKDSIGPKEQRKAHLDLAWRQYYTNDVGHDEYLQWAERVGFEPMYTINMGTGDINDAVSLIEYTNHSGGTYWSDLRKQYGHANPYGVKVWYLGNEADGPWQIGSYEKDPRGYGVKAHEISKAMKYVDPTIQTIACASSSPFLNTYPQWDLDVLEQCYDSVDMISLHHYHAAPPDNMAALLAGSASFEAYINTELAVCDFVQTKLRSRKKMMLSFDEFGSTYREARPFQYGRGGNIPIEQIGVLPKKDAAPYVRHDPDDWGTRPMMRRGGDMTGVLTSASIFLTLMRHADRVKIGCMTGGLMAACSSNRDHVWKSGGFYAYSQLIQYGRGESLLPAIECESYDVPGFELGNFRQYDTFEGLKPLESAVAYDEEKGEVNIFVINRSTEDDIETEIDVRGFEGYRLVEHVQMYSDDLAAGNTYENPNAVVPTVNAASKMDGGKVTANFKKLSWNVIRLAK